MANPKVFLKRGRANPVWRGHPWVYSGAIEREQGAHEAGDIVDVCDTDGHNAGLRRPRRDALVQWGE